jgi:hypothetical protein
MPQLHQRGSISLIHIKHISVTVGGHTHCDGWALLLSESRFAYAHSVSVDLASGKVSVDLTILVSPKSGSDLVVIW